MRTMLATALALLAGCESVERSFIYYPTRRLEATPADVGVPFEEIRVTAADGVRIHGWYVPGVSRAVTLLWCHGNAGNISHRLDNLVRMRERLGIAVLLFDYRGYGLSEGTPSEGGTYLDARAVRHWLAARAPAVPVVYFGRSLGAAVAARLTVDEPPAALVLETPFISVRAMANATVPGAGYLFRTRYDTLALMSRIRTPLLLLHGETDEVVPFRHGQAVFEAASEPKRFVRIPGARHNDTYLVGGAPYWQAWDDFLAIHVPGW